MRFRLLDARLPSDRAAHCGKPRDLNERVVAGDFDGDHTTDLFWYAPGAATDSIWSGTAQRTFTITPGPWR